MTQHDTAWQLGINSCIQFERRTVVNRQTLLLCGNERTNETGEGEEKQSLFKGSITAKGKLISFDLLEMPVCVHDTDSATVAAKA
jgi:hypothetical protein